MNSIVQKITYGGTWRTEQHEWPDHAVSKLAFSNSALAAPKSAGAGWGRGNVAVRSVAREIPKRSSSPPRLKHTTKDGPDPKQALLHEKRGRVEGPERVDVADCAHVPATNLILPAIDEEDTAQLVALLIDKNTWLRDVAVVAVLATAILSAVAEKEAEQQMLGSFSPSAADGSNAQKKVSAGDGANAQEKVVDVVGRRERGAHEVAAVPIDSLRRGRLVENGFVYRQTFVVRSYEVGFDRTASIGTLANLFQETALNHVGMSDFVGDGMGTTHAMMRHRLIWVVTKMHIQVVDYPVWGDVVEIDSWVTGSGKNGMRRDFLVRDYLTGHIRARATSHWAMMNQDTRKLSKMPDDVRAEISPYYLDRSVMTDDSGQRIIKLDDSAPYVKTGLVPRLHDMDMNQHVNHVKYISWVLESVPQSLLVAYELMGMTLEYRKECSHCDAVSSLTSPESPLSPCLDDEGLELPPSIIRQEAQEVGPPSIKNPRITTAGPLHYTHLLRLQGDSTEILRGRTAWRLKRRYS